MNQPDTDVVYVVVYQEEGDPSWYTFTNGDYQHAQYAKDETTDAAEAFAAAQGLISGALHTDKRPKYQRKVAAVQVYQRITTGGVLMTLGTPHRDSVPLT